MYTHISEISISQNFLHLICHYLNIPQLVLAVLVIGVGIGSTGSSVGNTGPSVGSTGSSVGSAGPSAGNTGQCW